MSLDTLYIQILCSYIIPFTSSNYLINCRMHQSDFSAKQNTHHQVVLHRYGILADIPITDIYVCLHANNTSRSDINNYTFPTD